MFEKYKKILEDRIIGQDEWYNSSGYYIFMGESEYFYYNKSISSKKFKCMIFNDRDAFLIFKLKFKQNSLTMGDRFDKLVDEMSDQNITVKMIRTEHERSVGYENVLVYFNEIVIFSSREK